MKWERKRAKSSSTDTVAVVAEIKREREAQWQGEERGCAMIINSIDWRGREEQRTGARLERAKR